jgi:hypothetical protein
MHNLSMAKGQLLLSQSSAKSKAAWIMVKMNTKQQWFICRSYLTNTLMKLDTETLI